MDRQRDFHGIFPLVFGVFTPGKKQQLEQQKAVG